MSHFWTALFRKRALFARVAPKNADLEILFAIFPVVFVVSVTNTHCIVRVDHTIAYSSYRTLTLRTSTRSQYRLKNRQSRPLERDTWMGTINNGSSRRKETGSSGCCRPAQFPLYHLPTVARRAVVRWKRSTKQQQ
jgi:hypothetical protein